MNKLLDKEKEQEQEQQEEITKKKRRNWNWGKKTMIVLLSSTKYSNYWKYSTFFSFRMYILSTRKNNVQYLINM